MTIEEFINTDPNILDAYDIQRVLNTGWNSIPDKVFDDYFYAVQNLRACCIRKAGEAKRSNDQLNGDHWRAQADRVEAYSKNWLSFSQLKIKGNHINDYI